MDLEVAGRAAQSHTYLKGIKICAELFFAHHYCAKNSSARILRKYRKNGLKITKFLKNAQKWAENKKKMGGCAKIKCAKNSSARNIRCANFNSLKVSII